jgi:hypothetical protein
MGIWGCELGVVHLIDLCDECQSRGHRICLGYMNTYGLISVVLGSEPDESESARPASVTVLDDNLIQENDQRYRPEGRSTHGLRPGIGVGRTYGLFNDAELFEFRTESYVIGVPRKAAAGLVSKVVC